MATLETAGKHQNLVDELIHDVEEYNPAVDRDLLTRAFHYAASHHTGQQRRSGEDFIAHPWAVATISLR
jgi:guanosine-3',5'-bis(diphosphate) 3'-pyrophosphohydrolase